ncbi:MAG: glycosyltransferase family 4 protein [Marivibrio sp.]|uniref:glycosyltransferase family 4 protein n=1 Tax=Marivibrio sp. TaxID=2039719 RepID=UPI0032EC618A
MNDADLFFVAPGRLDSRTGGSIYDRRMVEGLRALGRTIEVVEAPGGWPFPDLSAHEAASRALADLPDGAAVVLDGLLFGAVPDLAEREAARLRLIALVHHPLCDEAGLTPSAVERLMESERRALAVAAGVLATSRFTARGLARFGLDPEAVAVVEPGVEPAPPARGSAGEGPARLLCAATLIPRKGHDVLLRALSQTRDLEWRLDCAGKADLDPDWAAQMKSLARELDLCERIVFHGELSEQALADLFAESDLFVLASRYEGYGMAVAEALARALPVVTTTGGALADTLPDGAGVAVPPDDPAAFAAAIRTALADDAARSHLVRGARSARARLADWPMQSRAFADALDRLLKRDAG